MIVDSAPGVALPYTFEVVSAEDLPQSMRSAELPHNPYPPFTNNQREYLESIIRAHPVVKAKSEPPSSV